MSHIQKRLDQPMTYQVQVQGRLDASWSDWFDGLAVAVVDDTNGAPVTTLTGLVKDQAALHGLLARIRDLGLPLLLVQRVEPPTSPDTAFDDNQQKFDPPPHIL